MAARRWLACGPASGVPSPVLLRRLLGGGGGHGRLHPPRGVNGADRNGGGRTRLRRRGRTRGHRKKGRRGLSCGERWWAKGCRRRLSFGALFGKVGGVGGGVSDPAAFLPQRIRRVGRGGGGGMPSM